MKATFIKTLALSLLAVVTLGLSACKGDDTPNVPPPPFSLYIWRNRSRHDQAEHGAPTWETGLPLRALVRQV